VASDYGQGRVLMAKPALTAGMVDRIATLQETVNRLQATKPMLGRRSAELIASPALAASGSKTVHADPAWTKRMKGRSR
jgi:hypothetical protein